MSAELVHTATNRLSWDALAQPFEGRSWVEKGKYGSDQRSFDWKVDDQNSEL